MDIFIDMKYIITEKQLKFITENENAENFGKVFTIKFDIDKLLRLGMEQNPDFFNRQTEYTPEGYPIPTRVKNKTNLSMMYVKSGNILWSYNSHHTKPDDTIWWTGYLSPKGETFLIDFLAPSDDSLIFIPKNIIIDSYEKINGHIEFDLAKLKEKYENKNFDPLYLRYNRINNQNEIIFEPSLVVKISADGVDSKIFEKELSSF